MTPFLQIDVYTVKPLNSGLLRGVRYWEVIQKGLSHLGPNILSAIQGMSAIWNIRYW